MTHSHSANQGRKLLLLGGCIVLVLVGIGMWFFSQIGVRRDDHPASSPQISWSFNGTDWQSSGSPSACPEPLNFPSPVDVKKASAILYPGQMRGGDYKPHGGFVFNEILDNKVTVRAPLDAAVLKGARYIEQGETQYLLILVNPCGIMYRFDHLLTLAPALQKLADMLPPAQQNNSQTTSFPSSALVKQGDLIATAVGFAKLKRTTVDFGVYDLRRKNAASRDPAWREAHPHQEEYGEYALCWLNNLNESDKTAALALPGGDSQAGKQSDYCK